MPQQLDFSAAAVRSGILMADTADEPTRRDPWGEPPWRVEVEIPPRPAPAHCDVAVIGGGFTGLSTAYHLARRGCRVAVLEADRVGAGASGRTGGLALEGAAHGPLPGVECCLETLADVTDNAGIACDLMLGGCWEVAHDPGPPRTGIGWRDGDDWVRVVHTVPGGTVDPGALVAGLARAALAAGATIHEDTRAQGLEAGAPVRVHVDNGIVVSADHVVVALNGYTPELLSLPLTLRAPLTLALCTAPVDDAVLAGMGWGARAPFYTVDLPYLWGRWVADGRLIFGAGLVLPPDGSVRQVDIAGAEAVAILARLEARVRGLHPALADVAVTHRWGGPIAFLAHRDHPVLGALPDAPQILVAGAYAGHGVALSVRAGELLADAIIDGAPLPAWGTLLP